MRSSQRILLSRHHLPKGMPTTNGYTDGHCKVICYSCVTAPHVIVTIEHTASTIVRTIGFRGSRSQSKPQNATASQQPKTSPVDAFEKLGCCEHCGTAKRIDEARNARAILWGDPQSKKLSPRQKIDRQISRQQEQLRHGNNFTFASSTNAPERLVIGRQCHHPRKRMIQYAALLR